ncbi:MAG: hypothetical protein NUV61_00515 [Candidatus Azambacteria bacterium]|nr:hypothetical protein [Candidatus Azambacteria bacterium]
MKKKLKKTPSRSAKTTSQDQLGVILEDVKEKFDIIIEGQKASDQRLERKIVSSALRLEGKIDELRGDFVGFKNDTESNFKQVFQYLSRIEDELMSVKADIADIKKTLTQKADKDRVALLEERVAKLERQLVQAKR